MVYHRGLGLSLPGAQVQAIPASTTAAQLAAMALENAQYQPLRIALLVGAGLAVAFAPGFWKIVAAPLALGAYCYPQNCIISM